MLLVKRRVLAPFGLSLFLVVLGSAHPTIWFCVAQLLVASLRVYYRAACLLLLNSWSRGLVLGSSFARHVCVALLHAPILKTNETGIP